MRSVRTLEELDALDEAEILEGYWDGRAGEPEPGDNRSLAYWHGWRNGAHDGGHRKHDPEQAALCRLYLARERARREARILKAAAAPIVDTPMPAEKMLRTITRAAPLSDDESAAIEE